jgi:DNA polymerase I-like protein with 3'-5' exonuclease and polymerase domains
VIAETPNDTISKYYNNVKNYNEHKLKDILSKFEIQSEQQGAKDFFKSQLLAHPTIINPLKEEDRESFIVSLFGIISYQLIDDERSNKWEINIDWFRDNFRSHLKRYQIDDLIFPISNILVDADSIPSFRFVEELKNINYKGKIGGAIKDYLRASESQLKMIEERPALIEELEMFDDDIFEEMEDRKVSHNDKLSTSNEEEVKEQSKRFYDDCLDSVRSKISIDGVKGIRVYYPKGRVHNQVEEEGFTWKLGEEDES